MFGAEECVSIKEYPSALRGRNKEGLNFSWDPFRFL
jgi:hypothetical protein